MYKEFSFEVQYDVGQCIIRSKEPFVRGAVEGHCVSVVSRPLSLDGQRLARAILNPFL